MVGPVLAIVKNEFVTKIKDEDLRIALSDVLDTVQATAVVLADDDTNNAEQVKSLWLALVNTSVAALLDEKVLEAVDQIDNETIRGPLVVLAPNVVQMLRIVTDDDPDNKAQLEAHWKAFISDAKVQAVFFGVVDQLIEANLKDTAKTIAVAMWTVLKGVISGQLSKV